MNSNILTLSVDDLQIENLFTPWKHSLDTIGELLSAVGQRMVDAVHQNIDEEGRPDPWPPAAAEYGHPLLKDTMALYHSINFVVAGDTVSVDAHVDYAHFHNEGTSRIPQREFLNLDTSDEMDIMEIVAKHFD